MPSCTDMNSDFTNSIDGWVLQSGSTKENYEITSEGLQLKLLPPSEYIRLKDEEGLPYNKYEGSGCTFNATTYMQYGKFSATVKAAKVPGAVTAVILIADNGDEIDFELLANPKNQITSNYFYGPNIVYGKNGKEINAPNGSVFNEFYKYTIEWSPSEIKWFINDKEIRTKTRLSTKNGDTYEYPTHPARVQFGLWDGSSSSGTAQWAHGPIDWNKQKEPITAYIKNVQITCNPKYNNIKN
ncbi:concanavalin A-like lectin/glucanase domain-containing protein [Cokeromyces recurvatus]|uniref:concanavalin A-like lectin/glucanase domain-containing protein n=1 Tax=Cokeromyces recurvatus TaxID=90255 RepID=UPI002220BB39|nr:concanavalin A-like lectin/glucanase domain-containing protein [Cokeromyces recurvatus]KAI7901872.1 concanavalin A-like lectin/glucanase domain-containing protein [Cokeromyces recurvatus]